MVSKRVQGTGVWNEGKPSNRLEPGTAKIQENQEEIRVEGGLELGVWVEVTSRVLGAWGSQERPGRNYKDSGG